MTIEKRGSARRNLLTVPLLAASAAIAVAVTASSRVQALVAGIAFTALCLTIAFWRSSRNGRRDLFAPPVLLSAYLALGIGIKGIVDLLGETSKIQGLLDPTDTQFADLLTKVFLETTLAVLAFAIGDALAGRRCNASSPYECPRPLLPYRGLHGALLLSLGMTVLGAGVLVAKLGMAVVLDPTFVSTEGTIGLFWLYPLMFASTGGMAFVIVNRWSAGQRAGAPHLVALFATAVTVYLLTSSKSILIIAALFLMVGHHYAVRPARLRHLVLATVGFLLLLPLLYLHRAFGFGPNLLRSLTAETAGNGVRILVGRSYLADSFASVLQLTPRIYPFRLGATWLELFYFWIPRGIWPTKPLSQSLAFGTTYLGSFPQVAGSFYSPTLMGDAYLNFGTIGVCVVFLIAGYGLRRLYDRWIGTAPRPEGIVLYSMLVYWVAIGSEQSLAVVSELALSYLAPLMLLALTARMWPSSATQSGRFG